MNSRTALVLCTLLSAAPARSAQAVEGAAAQSDTRSPVRGLSTRAELESFLDGVMIANLRDKHIAGATVAVVKDGRLFLAKGYGFSDLAKRAPVDAEKTLFRIGSISKLFTWTAIHQLLEVGKVSLEADVNTYLDFKIPATYPEPITLRHMLTHTAGFEEDGRDLWANDSNEMVPLGSWLATHIPGRVRRPGEYSSYSNYAAALAGHVVERVSGMPWAEYIEQRVLAPLGMSQTSVRQPLPDGLLRNMSQGYEFADGQFTAKSWELIAGATPAGSMSASAADMAKFMLAHLGNGSYDGQRILSESTAEHMHARAFTHDDRLNGVALGFYEKSSHGLRIIGHGGNTRWFHSDLALIPAEQLGVFVSYNTNTGHDLSLLSFLTQFLDHYYPTAPVEGTAVASPAEARAQAARVVGEYAFLRRSYTTFQKAEGLADAVRITASDTGNLLMDSRLGTTELVPVGPLLYRDASGEDLVAFKGEGTSPATHAFLSALPVMALERLPWFESPELHWILLGSATILFTATLLAGVGRAYRRRFGTPRPEDPLPGRGLLFGAASFDLGFLIAIVMLASSPTALVTNPMNGLKIALALPIVGGLFALGAAFSALSQWRPRAGQARAGTLGARLRYGATVVAALLFVWSLNVWNLLGWRM